MTPRFWYQTNKHLYGWALSPLSALYSWASSFREKRASPVQLKVPLLCVGNLTLGGGGKTPTVQALTQKLSGEYSHIHILSKGYKGQIKAPTRVNLKKHSACLVGDEPLLHAPIAPTWIGKNRSAVALEAQNTLLPHLKAGLLIMDDGYQNPLLKPDFKLLVVDGPTGFGNGRVFPAGPLREPMQLGLQRADALLIIDAPCEALKKIISRSTKKPIYYAKKKINPPKPAPKSVVAFSGIAFPERFFDALAREGIRVLKSFSFPDHHTFSPQELRAIRAAGNKLNTPIFTTEKDYVRLPTADRKGIVPIPLSVDIPASLIKQIKLSLSRFHEKKTTSN